MQYKSVVEKYEIYKVLIEFVNVFPHLSEQLSNFEEYADKLSKNAIVCVVQENCENAGILVFYANDKQTNVAYISLIGIKKEYQHKGLGKKLLDYCVLLSKNIGMQFIRLEVDSDNSHAIEFYKRNGFKKTEETERNSFYMIKDIRGEKNG